MTTTINDLINKLKSQPENVEFNDVINVIEASYDYQACDFKNGDVINQAGTNEGSCKIFAFAQLNSLSEKETLACFGAFYREDVLKNLNGSDHGNIRNFIKFGWRGINFSQCALTAK